MSEYLGLVIAYRDHQLVTDVLAQLAKQTALPTEVIVVDNGGTLQQEDLLMMPLAHLTRLISRPDNPGYGAAVNEAKEFLQERQLLVLTHDAVFDEHLAEQLSGVLATDPQAGSVGPVLYVSSQRDRVFSAGGRLSVGGRGSHWAQPRSSSPYEFDWLDGAIVMYSSAALTAIDWLAEEYFLYFEDVDTGWRLTQSGFKNLIVPSLHAYQQPGNHPPYLGMRNMALFSRKASLPFLPHVIDTAMRMSREAIGQIRRGKPPQLWQSWRGWRDGRAGMTGKPTDSH